MRPFPAKLSEKEMDELRKIGSYVYGIERFLLVALLFAYNDSFLSEFVFHLILFPMCFVPLLMFCFPQLFFYVGPSGIGAVWLYLLDRLAFYLFSQYAVTLNDKGVDVESMWYVSVALAAVVNAVYLFDGLYKHFVNRRLHPQQSDPQDDHVTATESESNHISTEELDQSSEEKIDCPKEIDVLRDQMTSKLREIWDFLDDLTDNILEDVESTAEAGYMQMESTVEEIKRETVALRREVEEKMGKLQRQEDDINEKVETTFKKIRQEAEAVKEEIHNRIDVLCESDSSEEDEEESTEEDTTEESETSSEREWSKEKREKDGKKERKVGAEWESVVEEEKKKWEEEKKTLVSQLRSAQDSAEVYKSCMRRMAAVHSSP